MVFPASSRDWDQVGSAWGRWYGIGWLRFGERRHGVQAEAPGWRGAQLSGSRGRGGGPLCVEARRHEHLRRRSVAEADGEVERGLAPGDVAAVNDGRRHLRTGLLGDGVRLCPDLEREEARAPSHSSIWRERRRWRLAQKSKRRRTLSLFDLER
ncbi:hypothetical protein E2562_004139 [Oryza meyeriana var. granulata]|uniref:Uncharacterized protein n=1 Tax=Oryza meyeriana var. granulata TaxID=110450 RepID=A0A6G1EV56_9ORYZ|nr:hypothetical protein E2562_004139 [Oryza meyeriana var. granulata]